MDNEEKTITAKKNNAEFHNQSNVQWIGDAVIKRIEKIIGKNGLAELLTVFNDFNAGEELKEYQRQTTALQQIANNLIYVSIDNALITSATEDKYLIGTSLLATSAGIAMYDPIAKIGAVANVFFHKEETIIHYETDFQGRRIPTTERKINLRKLSPFSSFSEYVDKLVSNLKKKGGDIYYFYAFNTENPQRTKEQNLELNGVVERTITEFKKKGKLIDSQYRNETAFILDTRNGEINYHEN